MGLDSLFERLVIAQERIAVALETRLELVAQPPQPAADTGKKGRKTSQTVAEVKAEVIAEAPRVTVVETAPAAPAPSKSFLEEDEPTVEAAPPQKTPEEYRTAIRKTLQALQTLTTPEFAFKVLVDNSGTEKLVEIPADKFETTLKAAQAAVDKAQKRAA